MRKFLFLLFCAMSTVSCVTEKISCISPETEKFTINVADPDTKMVFADNRNSILWEKSDGLSVLIYNTEGNVSKNFHFMKGDAENIFYTESNVFEKESNPQTLYNYFTFYPYDNAISSIDPSTCTLKGQNSSNYIFNLPSEQKQIGIRDMEHIHVPLYGQGTAVGRNQPSVVMKHLVTILKIQYKNISENPITVKSLQITTGIDSRLTGNFTVQGSLVNPLKPTEQSYNTVKLIVTDGVIPPGETADFSTMVAPFILGNADKPEEMKIVLQLDGGDIQMSKIGSGKVFDSGSICTIPMTENTYIPETLFLVDSNDQIFHMTKTNPGCFVTSGNISTMSDKFRFAEKVTSSGIDWTGKVWGDKNGLSEIDQNGNGIELDPCYKRYSQSPERIIIDFNQFKISYGVDFWKPTTKCPNHDDCSVLWVKCIPESSEITFHNFDDVNLNDVLDPAVFGNIDDSTKSAEYLCCSDNFEIHYYNNRRWLFLMNNISDNKMVLVGSKAANGLANDLSFPIIENNISLVPGQTIQMYRRPNEKFYGSIYVEDGFGGSMYAGYGWGNMVKGYSSTNGILKINDGQWIAAGEDFKPGHYMLCYDPAIKQLSAELINEEYIHPEPDSDDFAVFPIISYTGVDFDHLSWFKEMNECGFNVYLGWYDTIEQVKTALDVAHQNNIKMIVSTTEFKDKVSDLRRSEVAAIMNHAALFMYHVADEPWNTDFNCIRKVVEDIRTVDQNHSWYVNLYPNWAWGGANGYRENISSYCDAMPVQPSILSFDNYPITRDGMRQDWYKNLEDIRAVSLERNIPFWGFALALAHNLDGTDSRPYFYPVPTLAELRLQQFSNLVYGAQGFQYFTFWGLYHYDGPTIVYDMVKTLNREIQALAPFFKNSQITNIWHTGSDIPLGTQRLSVLPTGVTSLKTSDGGAVVSQISKNGKSYLALVNKDYHNKMSLSISFLGDPKIIDKQGNMQSAAKNLHLLIDPGDLILFQL